MAYSFAEHMTISRSAPSLVISNTNGPFRLLVNECQALCFDLLSSAFHLCSCVSKPLRLSTPLLLCRIQRLPILGQDHKTSAFAVVLSKRRAVSLAVGLINSPRIHASLVASADV